MGKSLQLVLLGSHFIMVVWNQICISLSPNLDSPSNTPYLSLQIPSQLLSLIYPVALRVKGGC